MKHPPAHRRRFLGVGRALVVWLKTYRAEVAAGKLDVGATPAGEGASA